MIYIQIIIFILTNAPKIISAVRELIAMFKRREDGKEQAYRMYGDMQMAKRQAKGGAHGFSGEPADTETVLRGVVQNYRKKCAR